MKYSANIFWTAVLVPVLTICVFAQTQPLQRGETKPSEQPAKVTNGKVIVESSDSSVNKPITKGSANQSDEKSKAELNLSDEEAKLVDGSKATFIKAGITAPYFNEHFKLIKVDNQVGDRKVIWEYSVNDYKTLIKDSVGFYTSQNGNRVNVHSVANTFRTVHEINKTISKAHAAKILKKCLGKYTNESVAYGTSAGGRVGLFLTAVTAFKESSPQENNREKRKQKIGEILGQNQPDVVDKKPYSKNQPVFIGFVNLETGQCSKTRVKTSARQ
jgi:hypothetical protein